MTSIMKPNKSGAKGSQIEGAKVPSYDVVTATSGALDINKELIVFDTTAGAGAYTLPDGQAWQEIELRLSVDGGDAVITYNGTDTATLGTVNQALVLVFDPNQTDWVVKHNVGTVVIA